MRSAPAFHRASIRNLASLSGCVRLGLLLLAVPAALAGAVASLALLALALPFVALGAGRHRPPLRLTAWTRVGGSHVQPVLARASASRQGG